jgi:hypothetical protein
MQKKLAKIAETVHHKIGPRVIGARVFVNIFANFDMFENSDIFFA